MNRSILSVGVALTLSAVSFAQEMGNYTFINKSNKPHQFTVYTLKEESSNGLMVYVTSVNVLRLQWCVGKVIWKVPLNTDDFYAAYIVEHIYPAGPQQLCTGAN